MKATKTLLKKMNEQLASYGLELEQDKYSNQIRCYCTTLSQTEEQRYNTSAINSELRAATELKEILFMPYFQSLKTINQEK